MISIYFVGSIISLFASLLILICLIYFIIKYINYQNRNQIPHTIILLSLLGTKYDIFICIQPNII